MGLFDFFKKKNKPLEQPVETYSNQFIFFKLSINNCQAKKDVYECIIDENSAKLTHLLEGSHWEDMEEIKDREIIREVEGKENLRDEVLSLLSNCSIRKWAGFNGPNPKGVLDGSSMTFEAHFDDGTKIYASGCNNFPKEYGKFRNELSKMSNYHVINSVDFTNKQLKIKLPENWIGRIQASFNSDFVCFSMDKGDKNSPLIRVDFHDYGYGSDDINDRVGRIINNDNKDESYFISVYQFDGFYTVKELLNEEETAICQEAISEAMKKQIIESIDAVDGWTLVREDGNTLYENDARILFDKARSIWLSLFLGGDYSSGCKVQLIDGKKYKTFSATYEHPAVRNIDELKERMLKYFDGNLVEKIISEKMSENALVEVDNFLYTDFRKSTDPYRYGGFGINNVTQISPDSATITINVKTALPSDEQYRYSGNEQIEFEIIKNSNGKYVFKTFPFWEKSKWEE